MHQWMRSRGVHAAVASPGAGSTIDPTIPRVSLLDNFFGDVVGEGANDWEGGINTVAGSASALHLQLPPSFSTAPVFCELPSSLLSSNFAHPPCVTVSHPQDGFAFTQWERQGPLEWRLEASSSCSGGFHRLTLCVTQGHARASRGDARSTSCDH